MLSVVAGASVPRSFDEMAAQIPTRQATTASIIAIVLNGLEDCADDCADRRGIEFCGASGKRSGASHTLL